MGIIKYDYCPEKKIVIGLKLLLVAVFLALALMQR
jgi:hypothetical protein